MAAVRRAADSAPGLSFQELVTGATRVFVLGDGRRPFTAAAMCLASPDKWRLWSIDPLMMDMYTDAPVPSAASTHALGSFAERLTCVRGLSQEFEIPPASEPGVTVLLAVHSHCPLGEFWHRAPRPRLCISLPCCAIAGAHTIDGAEPLLTYSDQAILSPHRTVVVYYDPAAPD